MNALITIESKHDVLKVHHGKLPGSRIVWVAAGLTVMVKGPLNGMLYEQAGNLALNVCHEMHIPAISLKRYNAPANHKKPFDTKSRRMF